MKQDQFVTTVFKLREWAEENVNTVLIGIGAVVLVAAAVWFFASQSSRREKDSYELLGRAESEIRNDQNQIALIDLQKVLDDYSGSDAAKLASFKLANLYYATNDFEKAEKAFRQYIDKYALDDISRQSANEGIAASLGGQGKYLDAAKDFLSAAQADTLSVTYEDNLLHAVDFAIKGGDQQLARDAFALLGKRPFSDKYRTAKVLLIEKGVLAYDKGEYK